MRWRWAFLIALAPWALSILGLGLSKLAAGPADNIESPATPVELQVWTGSGSCAGRGCHGNVNVAGTLGTEYNTWITLDKHATAFQVLSNEVSESIQDRLGVETKAMEDRLCLSCHGHPAPVVVDGPNRDAEGFQPIGIGCESCHGAAGNWLDTHYQLGWKELSEARKSEHGLKSLSTLTQRARVCTDCHVGESLDRQVHHDLIAAGHPRLNFEFSSAMARMPRHWAEQDNESSEAQAWAVGQVVTLQSALQLLQDRAIAAVMDEQTRQEWLESPSSQKPLPKSTQPWPEFSEYSCFACHHDLRDTGLLSTNFQADQQPGALSWNTWGLPMVRALAKYENQTDWLEQLDLIDRQMQLPYPDPEQVAHIAGQAAEGLDPWIKALDDPEHHFSKNDLRDFLVKIESDSLVFQNLTAHWDAAAQFYLALRALERDDLSNLLRQRALPGVLERDFHDRLGQMVKYLRFPDGQNSPRSTSASKSDTDSHKEFIQITREILEQLGSMAVEQ